MSTTSTLPKNWVTGPLTLISSPQSDGLDINSHLSIYIANVMVHIHNLFIRALNSIILQSPHINEPKDIASLLDFARILTVTIHHHHAVEEEYFFPGITAVTKDAKLMATNEAQHASFHEGLEAFQHYCTTTTPATYDAATFKRHLDAFTQPLYNHLVDEIPTILALRDVPDDKLKPIWAAVDKHANDGATYDEMFPLVFGCTDAGYEGGQYKFPPVPGFMAYMINWWYAPKNANAWRMNPSDAWGRPRELVFLPKEK